MDSPKPFFQLNEYKTRNNMITFMDNFETVTNALVSVENHIQNIFYIGLILLALNFNLSVFCLLVLLTALLYFIKNQDVIKRYYMQKRLIELKKRLDEMRSERLNNERI